MSNYGDPNYGQQGGQGGYGGDPYGAQPGDPTYQGQPGGYGDPTYQGQPGGYADPNSAPPGYGAPGYADPNSAPPGYGPGGPGYGDPGFGAPPPPPPPKKSSTGLIIGIVAAVVVLILCIGGGVGAFFIFKPGSSPSTNASGGTGNNPTAGPTGSSGGGSTSGGGPAAAAGATHKVPSDACSVVDVTGFSNQFGYTLDTSTSPNPKSESNKYSSFTTTRCSIDFVKGSDNPELEVELTIQTSGDAVSDASRDYDSEIKSSTSVYGAPINVRDLGQKATGYKASSGSLHLYVLDGNMVIHAKYFNAGSDHAVSQGDTFQKALSQAAQTAMNRTV